MVIEIDKLHVKYDHVVALEDVSFKVNENEFLGIIGPNGGGKTSLIKAILNLIKPASGSIKIAQDTVIGYVPQLTTFDRNFPITVGEVILTGHLPKKITPFRKNKDHEASHALEVMEYLGIEKLYSRQIGQLSGGQMQKVLIARALMNHPNVLILDEPTAGVDEESRKAIFELLNQLNDEMTIMIISHNTEELMSYLDRVIYINRKVHIHDNVRKSTKDSCPIDWFIKGKAINENMNKY